jgi:hypothetical protein
MSQEYDQFENWAQSASGNHFVLYSLMECIQRNQLTARDTVGIMWTGITREDRYVNDQWLPLGSVYVDNSPYPQEYIERFTDPTGYLLTNLSVVQACRLILDSIGCRYYFFSMVPLHSFTDLKVSVFRKLFSSPEKKILD